MAFTVTAQSLGLIAIDFDGVLTPSPEACWPPAEVDLTLIRLAQARGYAVAIMTCNADVRRVAAELVARGIAAVADPAMSHRSWSDPGTVLVTNRKVIADFYVDDRAVRYRFGDPVPAIFGRAGELAAAPCPRGPHWGAHGAAGVLPWAIWRGRLYVLLGLRGRHVQQPGTWSVPGGALEDGEDERAAALRELHEEIAGLDGIELGPGRHARQCPACGWSYATFLAEVPARDTGLPAVSPVSRGETGIVRWFRAGGVAGLLLHPAFAQAWPELRGWLREEAARQWDAWRRETSPR